MIDDDTGEPALVLREVTAPTGVKAEAKGSEKNNTGATTKEAADSEKGAAVVENEKRGSTAWFRGLAADTAIIVDDTTTKRKQSGTRLAAYKGATTIGELEKLNLSFFLKDLAWDYGRGIVRIPSTEDSLTPLNVFPCSALSTAAHRNLREQTAELLEEARSRVAQADRSGTTAIDAAAATHSERLCADEQALGERSPTLRRVLELGRLEGGTAEPQLIGDQGSLQALHEACTKAEAAPPAWAPAGDGLNGYSELPAPPNGQHQVRWADETLEGSARVHAAQTARPLRSIAQALRRPDWEGPGGIREAAMKEVKRCFEDVFPGRTEPTIFYVPYRNYEVLLAKHGPTKVQTKGLVVPIKGKFDPTKPNTVTEMKVRFTVADINGDAVETYAANVNPPSVKTLVQEAVEKPLPGEEEATLTISDVPGAYYRGTPPPVEENGREIFARIPKGFEQLGMPAINPTTGERMIFHVKGNLPGLQNAGAIWQKRCKAFMLQTGFTQSVVDRQIFFMLNPQGRLMLAAGIHVDDNLVFSRNQKMLAEFNKKWESEYNGTTKQLRKGQPLGFLGSSIELNTDNTISMGGERLYEELKDKVKELYNFAHSPNEGSIRCEVPMHKDGLQKMRLDDTATVMSPASQKATRSAHGVVGFIACQLRPDADLAYVSTAQYVAHRFTPEVLKAVIQVSEYLVRTRDMRLIFRPSKTCEGLTQWETWADSSSNNAFPGSFGGHITMAAGSAAVAWRAFTPKRLADSSGGSELILATHALKATILNLNLN